MCERGVMAAQTAWRRERDDLLRGVSGGMLVGVPLLYTMEVWGRGSELGPGVMAIVYWRFSLASVSVCRCGL